MLTLPLEKQDGGGVKTVVRGPKFVQSGGLGAAVMVGTIVVRSVVISLTWRRMMALVRVRDCS